MSGVRIAPARFSQADEILREACGTRFTAAVLRVELRGRPVFERAYGATDALGGRAVDGSTRFDLASLTKIYVSTAVLRTVSQGAIDLDAPLGGTLREWRGRAHEPITVRMLLAHSSGMQSGADYRLLLGDDVEAFALTRPLVESPGERVIYSDLGFIALGVVLERVHRTALSTVVANAAAAVGAFRTAYRPSASLAVEIPATEDDGWRGRLRGVVHDEKAFLMNGVAGHAGLFGPAADVARLAEAYLGALAGRHGLIPPNLAREAVAEAAPDGVLRRGLGWALKTTDENSCGRLMSPETFGHTGFTGTCMWADPRRDLSVVLLTNAVYFGRSDVRDFRAAVCDAVTAEVDVW